MINTYFKDLNAQDQQLAIQKMAIRTNSSTDKVISILERCNPLMEIQGDEVVLFRRTYKKLLGEFCD